jgi:hypothetical protein
VVTSVAVRLALHCIALSVPQEGRTFSQRMELMAVVM